MAFLDHQAVTHPATVQGEDLDVTQMEWLRVECYHGFNEATANSNPGSFLIQTAMTASGDEDWVTVVRFTVASGTPASEAFAETEPALEATIAVASTTGFAADELVYIRDATLANSEWAIVQEIVTNTSITVVDGLTRGHAATTTTIFDLAEKFPATIDVRGAERARCVYIHEGATGANVHVKAEARGFDA